MRLTALAFAVAALAATSAQAQPQPAAKAPPSPTAVTHDLRTNVVARTAPANTAAEIAAIEQVWGQAFLKGDFATIESLVAPEFKLMGEHEGKADFTPRANWMANARGFVFHAYDVRTVDVVAAGDTAVATVEGYWKIGRKGLPGTRESRFIVSDTFVRRGGKWQVIYRHATAVGAPVVTGAAAKSERGRE